MNIDNIETLTLNPHFFKHLIMCFFAGYEDPCDIRKVFMVLPILLYGPAREKLSTGKSTSSFESLFEGKYKNNNDVQISSKTMLISFSKKYDKLKNHTKQTIIILCNQELISINNRSIITKKKVTYKDKVYIGECKKWMKAAHYLGVILHKSTAYDISYFLGVE